LTQVGSPDTLPPSTSDPHPQRHVERFYSAGNRIDAYLLLHRLQQAGIVAHVFNQNMSSIAGEVPPDVAQPQVWLERASDRVRADRVLAAMQAERKQTGTVFCRACAEENPTNFELCWRCGANL
jgi:hypothetical protein